MSPQKKSRRKSKDSKRLHEFIETGHKLTQKELESHLWESANILRGSIDAADYKNYIFGLLFLKRLSDVFEEEAENIENETGDIELAWKDPDEHQFFVPEVARWGNLSKKTENKALELNNEYAFSWITLVTILDELAGSKEAVECCHTAAKL